MRWVARIAALWAVSVCAVRPANVRAVEAIWIGPANGSWNTAANWSTGAVPNSTVNVHIDDNAAQNSTLTSSASLTVPWLTIDAGDSLIAANGLYVSNGAEVNGTLNVTGSLAGSIVVNVGPTGRIEMPASTSALNNLPYVAPGGLVRGRGLINVFSVGSNDGEIRADIPGQLLTLSLSVSATLTNMGRLTAVGGGTLKVAAQIQAGGGTLWGGRIESNPGSTVILGTGGSTTTISDATIAGIDDTDPLAAAPVINFASTSLGDPTFEGSFTVPTGSSASFTGFVTNKAQITMAPATSSPYFFPASDTSLLGGGSFLMQEGFLFSAAAGTRFYNVDNTIHGTGTITSGFGFTNRGTINADVASSLSLNLTSAVGPTAVTDVNSGTMRSSGGGYLRFGSILVQNYEGTTLGKIIVGQNSVVELANSTISGGIIQCEGSVAATQGRFRILSSAIFQDVTVQGTFRTASNVAATMGGQVNNQGVIAAPINVSGSGSLQLNGTGEVLIDTAWLTMSTGRLTNQQNLIHGSGTTNATGTFVNHSTVRADGTLTFNAPGLKLSNSGRLEAGPGGTLDLSKLDVSNVDGAIGGTVFAANGGTVLLTTIHGGTLATDGTGVIKIGASTGIIGLDSVHNTGNLQTSSTRISGNITNDGLMTGTVSVSQVVQFSGTGTWDAKGTQAFLAALVVNGSQHTIQGDGPLVIYTFRNEGTVTAKGTSVFSLGTVMMQNYGLIDTPLGTTFSSTGNFVDNEGILRSGGAMRLLATDSFKNHAGGIVDVTGTLSLDESTILRNDAGGLVKGSGTINRIDVGAATTLINEGTVAPGDGLKTLSIGGKFQQLATGRLKMDIDTGDALTSDLLAVNGAAAIAGTLDVSLTPGDTIALGDSFTLLTATQGVAGMFDHFSLPDLGNSMFWIVSYSVNEVRITAADVLLGDYNHDSVVDTTDYLVWKTTLNSTTALSADGNGNNVVDDGDYDVWRTHFGQAAVAGGSGASATAVPEPGCSTFLVIASLVCGLRRRRCSVTSRRGE